MMTDQLKFIRYVHNEKTKKALDDIQIRITNYMAVDPAIIGGAIRRPPEDILCEYKQRMESHIMKMLERQMSDIMGVSMPDMVVENTGPRLCRVVDIRSA